MQLPTGTVTMLFADIEGSTSLLTRLGARYAAVLDAYRSILRSAWADWSGHEMGTEGDSFFVVFADAGDAAQAALQAQQGLSDPNRTAGEPVRVRMGIHSGEPMLHGDGYVGIDVHRAARITSVAHGGQIVLSETTRTLLPAWDDGTVVLEDLGFHRLKDLAGREHLFQLTAPGLRNAFPPLRSLGAATQLPRPATPLLGRERELAEVRALLVDPGVRLVTLTGAGGAGKTRLALEAGALQLASFEDGVYFVPLSGAVEQEVVWSTIAETLDLPAESRTQPAVLDHLATRAALFVLDNLEQVEDADTVIGELLSAAARSTVLATSRRPSHVVGEHEYPVSPLALPRSAGDAGTSAAVQLFVQRAQMVRPGFRLTDDNAADIATLCARLDGLPLAIELAAARSKLLSPRAVLARIDDVLDFNETGRGRPARQMSLRDTIRWSYDLLEPDLQTCFRRLGVFAGGAGLDAVASVLAASAGSRRDPTDLVLGLLDASLVSVADGPDGEPRIEMLETVRAYAVERLREATEYEHARRAHADHFLALTESLHDWEFSPRASEARERLEREHDNLREALGWALDSHPAGSDEQGRSEVAIRLCRELAQFWRHSGFVAEGQRFLERALARAAESGGSVGSDVVRCQTSLALLLLQGQSARALEIARDSVAMARRLGDEEEVARALNTWAVAEDEFGDVASARAHLEETIVIARRLSDPIVLASALNDLSNLVSEVGDLQLSLTLLDEALVLNEERGNVWGALLARYNRACVIRELGETDAARQALLELVKPVLAYNNASLNIHLAEDLATVVGRGDDARAAVRLLGAAQAARTRLAMPIPSAHESSIEQHLQLLRARLDDDTWADEFDRGTKELLEDALAAL